MSDKFTQAQPKDGDTVLHCGHLEEIPHHFFAMSDPRATIQEQMFRRPDGTTGRAKWMVLCARCFPIHFENPGAVMRADGKWIGDEAAIKENLQ